MIYTLFMFSFCMEMTIYSASVDCMLGSLFQQEEWVCATPFLLHLSLTVSTDPTDFAYVKRLGCKSVCRPQGLTLLIQSQVASGVHQLFFIELLQLTFYALLGFYTSITRIFVCMFFIPCNFIRLLFLFSLDTYINGWLSIKSFLRIFIFFPIWVFDHDLRCMCAHVKYMQ